MAEYLLRNLLEETGLWNGVVSSAGVSALVNQPADKTTTALMLSRGIAIDLHRARQLTQQSIRQSDLVLVMEKHHLRSVYEIDTTARGKTYLLGYWCNTEIADPFQRGDTAYATAVESIESCLELWIDKIVI